MHGQSSKQPYMRSPQPFMQRYMQRNPQPYMAVSRASNAVLVLLKGPSVAAGVKHAWSEHQAALYMQPTAFHAALHAAQPAAVHGGKLYVAGTGKSPMFCCNGCAACSRMNAAHSI
jgi:hypothetical protein